MLPKTAKDIKDSQSRLDFSAIPFCVVPSHHSLEGGVDVRGHSFSYVIPQRRPQPPPNISENSVEVFFHSLLFFLFPFLYFLYLCWTDLEFNGRHQ